MATQTSKLDFMLPPFGSIDPVASSIPAHLLARNKESRR
jgi:hypothetical protein